MTGRYLALDYGRRRIGLAVSDELGLTSRPLETIDLAAGVGARPGPGWQASPGALSRAAERIVAICRELRPVGVVIGEPRDPGGGAATGAAWIAARSAELRTALDAAGFEDLPILQQDESGSTKAALSTAETPRGGERALRESGRLDAMAAAVILRQFLAEQAEPPEHKER